MTLYLVYESYNLFTHQVEYTYRAIESREAGEKFIADMKRISRSDSFRIATGEELAEAKLKIHSPRVRFIAGPPFTVIEGYGK